MPPQILPTAFKLTAITSLSLLTGLSYAIPTISLPSLLALPSAASASHAYNRLLASASAQTTILSTLSGASFIAAFLSSRTTKRHPYLLWCTLAVASAVYAPNLSSGLTGSGYTGAAVSTAAKKDADVRKKNRRGLEASYEVVGDGHSEGNLSEGEIAEDEYNGEEVRRQMEGLGKAMWVRFGVAATGLLMSVVGIWGDGA